MTDRRRRELTADEIRQRTAAGRKSRTDSDPIYKLVIDDIEAKAQVGREKYGTYLQADNGRDHLSDAYQESIDQAKYLKAAIIERRALLDRIAALEAELDNARLEAEHSRAAEQIALKTVSALETELEKIRKSEIFMG